MHCPFCGADNTQVTDTRENEDGDIVRRRRRCLSCDKRFTTYERIDLKMPQVVKKNGSRADYSRDKLLGSLSLALRKRPVTAESVEAAVDRIEAKLLSSGEREIPSERIGELVMRELKKLDKVAYIRFASVYRAFEDVDEFSEVTREVSPPPGGPPPKPPWVFPRPPTADDYRWMARALELAKRGLLTTTPNPRVGCIIVREDRIVGEGWHVRAGEPHAEVHALAMAGEQARNATAYVTLEPCSHFGRTPPCAEALVSAGVARVVVAMEDPNPLVAGRGLARLRDAGIVVISGVQEIEARELNIGFISRMTRGRPWLRLKAAATLDGKTALENGVSQWITGDDARRDAHRWRARSCAVLTGIGTVRDDDPQLTVRAVPTERQPLRVVVDARLETPLNARLLDGGPVLVAAAIHDTERIAALERRGAEVVVLPNDGGKVDLQALLFELGRRGLNEVLAESGFKLNGSLLKEGCVDELVLCLAPAFVGDAVRGLFNLPALSSLAGMRRLAFHDVRLVGRDLRIIARPD